MDERRRFQIALGGIASCLLIAALVVSSAPPLAYPAVPRAGLSTPAPLVRHLPPRATWEPPALVHSTSTPRTTRPVLRGHAIARFVGVHHVETSPVVLQPIESAPLETRAPQIVLTSAPAAHAAAMDAADVDAAATADGSGERGPVSGAFVTAGREVGRGFRTAGRAIKSIF